MENLKVTVELTEKEAYAAQLLVDELISINFFSKIPIDCLVALEKFVASVNHEIVEQARQAAIKKRLENMRDWSEEVCATCNHKAHDHALSGLGLCIICGPCMKFVKKL